MPTANFQNYDYEAEAAAIKQQQALAEEMRQRSLMTPQLPTAMGGGQVQAKLGISPMIANVLQGMLARRGASKAEDRQKTLAERYANDLREGMQQYQTTAQGTPGITLPPDQAGPTVPGAQGDPRKAVLDALASTHPVLRDFAMKQLAEQGKGQLTPEKLSALATPESVLANPNQPGAWAPKRELKGLTPGAVLVDAGGNIAQPGGSTPNNPGWSTVKLDGDLYQITPAGLKKLDNAPKVSVSNTSNVSSIGQKAGSMEYFKDAAKQVGELGKAAGSSQELLNTLGTLKELHASGINSGITTDIATTLQNLGQKLGMKVDAGRLANTETYNSLITDLWQRAVSQYGGNRGVTASEAEQIKKLTPLASTSPQAREQLFAIMEASSRRAIDKYKQANKSFARAASADDPMLFEIPDYVQGAYTPEAGNLPNPEVTPARTAPISLDEYLQGVR